MPSSYALSDVRAQLLASGYQVLPNVDKRCMLKDWNVADYAVLDPILQSPKGWPRRFPALGVRVTGSLRVLDLDIDDVLVDQVMLELRTIAPAIAASAPLRRSTKSPFKLALFCRAPEGDVAFGNIRTHKYSDGDKVHCLEVFGGGPTMAGKVTKQVGIYGPHSTDERGQVLSEYTWDSDRPRLDQAPLGSLPSLSYAQANELRDAFERIAEAAGWTPIGPAPTAQDGTRIIWDITEATRFTMMGGEHVDYDGLCEAWDQARGELRCSAPWVEVPDTGRRDKCKVSDRNRSGSIGVFDFEDDTLHLPLGLQPLQTPKPEELAEALRKMAADQGLPLPPRTPPWRDLLKGGKPRPTLANALVAIAACGLTCSEDTFHNRNWIGRSDAASPAEPLQSFIGEINDSRILQLRVYLDQRYGFDLTEKHVRDAVLAEAARNRFDPVVDMLAEAQASWDGKPRLDRMAVDFFNTADTPLNRAFVRKTMIAAVARARTPGCKFDTILVMESPQGWNKSTAWAILAGEGNFSDEKIMGRESREVQEQLAGVWIHENAELFGMSKAEVNAVTAFASRVEDRARPAYGRLLVAQPRHSVEVGTTNETRYLRSQVGNRRFWPITLEAPIDLAKLKQSRLQLWGEAAALQAAGESLALDRELWELAGVEQEQRRERDPWEDILAELALTTLPNIIGTGHELAIVRRVADQERVTTADIFKQALKMPNSLLDMRHGKRLADVMRHLGWERSQFRVNGVSERGYARQVGHVGQ